MNKDYVNSFGELFEGVTVLTPERLQSFMTQTLEYLLKLRVQLSSSDSKEREEALSAAMELQTLLGHQMAKLGETIDLSEVSEREIMERMSKNDLELLAHAEEQFTELKSFFMPVGSNKEQ
jgi:hypothetical protein